MSETTPAAVGGQVERRVMQHTPGPWEVMSGDNYEVRSPLLPREYPHQCKEDSTGDFVAYIGNHAQDFGWANACLIAAAPDLFAAIQGAIARCESGTGGYVGTDGQFIKTMRAAVAKALGDA